ncbi:hypothetical protein QQF64_008526 [Cirrhinus molitorella]|uniref:Uncharacterized protein n=1 Tax=Cirrhinus molitorella TaxID=172907 RepID=A0ABR3M9R9_9TELE
MPTEVPEPPMKTWLAGCGIPQDPPEGAPEGEIKINGKPFTALLDSGSTVSLERPNVLSSPFELLFGRQPQGLLDMATEGWEQQLAPHRTVVEHVREMRERLDRVIPLVREHLSKAQQAQQRHYNRAAQPREFQPGDRVMALVPTAACKFLATWQGPCTVLENVGPITYHLRQPES